MQTPRLSTPFSSLLRALDAVSKPQIASAHCDVPCGVYEPDSMVWAAETVEKLTEKLSQLPAPAAGASDYLHYLNTVTRAVLVKEQYAQICKEQILILWTDYFKPEHVQKWPDLHEKIWLATKQCSQAKRSVSMDEAKKLKSMVTEIADIFRATKKP